MRARLRVAALCLALAGCEGASGDDSPTPTPTDPASARASVRVRVAAVAAGRVERRGVVSAVVAPFRMATVSAEGTGRVVERAAEAGDRVEAGAALLVLDATRSSLAEEQAGATLRAREVDLAEARSEYERGERLKGEATISDSRFDALRFGVERARSARTLAEVDLRRARRAVADATLRAPFAGTVESVHVDVGDYLNPGVPAVTVVDLSRARLRAGVTASEAAVLEAGSEARVVFDDLGTGVATAAVRSVGRVADPASGTYTVELWVDNDEGRLRDGMVASVELPARAGDVYPVVPRAALLRRAGVMSLFVVEGDGPAAVAVARPVRIGQSSRDAVEIVEGAAIGELVVVEGQFALRDGASVQVESGG